MRWMLLLLIVLINAHFGKAQDPINCGPNTPKNGYWVIMGKDRPTLNYPLDGKVEEGNYVNNRKEGVWIKYHNDGVTPKLKGEYKNNRPNGRFTKFFPSGLVSESGNFNGKHYIDTLYRYWENGNLRFCGIYDTYGESIVDSFFYYQENNCLDYTLVFSRSTNLKETITYSRDSCNSILSIEGKSQSVTICYGPNIRPVNPVIHEEIVPTTYTIDSTSINNDWISVREIKFYEESPSLPLFHSVRLKSGAPQKDGYLKFYNKDDEIFLDGNFKDYQLWDGKVYVYDPDGILLRVKIYKEGKYHSDGQL